MKTGLIVCSYNRPEYLRRCLNSLSRCKLSDVEIIFVDDCSTEFQPDIKQWDKVHLIFKDERKGICDSLLQGYAKAWDLGCELAMNLDADSIVRNDFIETMQSLHSRFPDDIVTGFHSITKNKDGSERHKIIGEDYDCVRKESVGGINMGMRKRIYDKYMKPTLIECLNGGNFDHKVSLKMGSVICAVPSVIQHIGIESSLGHTHDAPDVADDFKMLNLPNVTLVCVDDRKEQADPAIDKSIKDIAFGKVLRIHPEGKLGSKEAYSKENSPCPSNAGNKIKEGLSAKGKNAAVRSVFPSV